ncbi:hypothetical protein OS493_018390 [Desmophyllum pertusum]|uniref:VWFA domain-containing protein n=1 Tax=Desmophyllum pertusum TaxID=174260 RepID=A0A9X0D8L2_9CNID|nr:hypothetical protein OS493_018390 [Desmophyllum pertusum]
MLLNDRDPYSKYHQPGYRLDWRKWKESTHSLACRCAEKARAKGYTMFGLQFYGECWSGPQAELNFNRDGVSNNGCVMNLVNPPDCTQSSNQECMGTQNVNYIYKLTENCDKMMDVGIVVDSSSSVRRRNYELVKTFLIDLVDKMHVSTRLTHVAVIHYSHRAYLDWGFSSDRAQNAAALKKAIKVLKYQPGGTRTDKAMELAWNKIFKSGNGERPNVPHVLLIITDGITSRRSKPYPVVLKPFKENNIKVVAVGVGGRVDRNELNQIAMNKAENVVHLDQFGELASKIKEILKILCASRKV